MNERGQYGPRGAEEPSEQKPGGGRSGMYFFLGMLTGPIIIGLAEASFSSSVPRRHKARR